MNIKLDIPESFYQGEERCGYYVSPEMKKVWAVELDLLAEFARVCKKHNITWYADGGTLLGATRHKGFIPWDDDVDVVMMRRDYERLCEVAKDEFTYPYLFDYAESKNKHMPSVFAKLRNESTTMIEYTQTYYVRTGKKMRGSMGIYIDIFILNDLPDDEEAFNQLLINANKAASKFYTLCRLENYYSSPSKYRGAIKFILFRMVQALKALHINLPSYQKYFDEFAAIIKSCNLPDSKRVGQLAFIYEKSSFKTNIWERSWFAETVYLPFEMLELPADAGHERRLDVLYGDWHTFAVKIPHSNFYDTERPYTYYLERGHI